MRYTLTATTLSAALLISAAAYADNPEAKTESQAQTGAQASIESLPDSGAVSLSGIVDKVEDNKSFILRDTAGETIRVQAASEIDVNEGDRVSVRGEKSSKVAGLGEEITSASVTPSTEDMSPAAAAGAAAAGAAGAAKTAASEAAENASPYATRTSAEEQKAASSYMKEEPRSMESAQQRQRSEQQASSRMEQKDEPRAGASKTETTEQDMAAKDTIDSLPREGSVELSGVVEKVSDEKSFILRDAEGKTIDIHTASNVEVRPGDMVSVNGSVKSKLLGLGREIESAKVLVVSAAE